MISFLEGRVRRITPTLVWVECHGVGYELQISLKTFEQIKQCQETMLYTFLQIREDAHVLFGFVSEEELNIFKLLIQVSGISGNTARMILSSLSSSQVVSAIRQQNATTFRTIKGIGNKIAERIVLELKTKVDSFEGSLMSNNGSPVTEVKSSVKFPHHPHVQEAFQALQSLGISKAQAESVCDKIASSLSEDEAVEHIIKRALHLLS